MEVKIMKALTFSIFALVLSTPLLVSAQSWDDIYGGSSGNNSSKTNTQDKSSYQAVKNSATKTLVIRNNGDMTIQTNGDVSTNFDVDAYNRRYTGNNNEGNDADTDYAMPDSTDNQDYQYTDRIVKFHNPQNSVTIASDDGINVYVDNDNYDSYYADRDWNFSIGWGYPFFNSYYSGYYGMYSPWYTGWYSPFYAGSWYGLGWGWPYYGGWYNSWYYGGYPYYGWGYGGGYHHHGWNGGGYYWENNNSGGRRDNNYAYSGGRRGGNYQSSGYASAGNIGQIYGGRNARTNSTTITRSGNISSYDNGDYVYTGRGNGYSGQSQSTTRTRVYNPSDYNNGNNNSDYSYSRRGYNNQPSNSSYTRSSNNFSQPSRTFSAPSRSFNGGGGNFGGGGHFGGGRSGGRR